MPIAAICRRHLPTFLFSLLVVAVATAAVLRRGTAESMQQSASMFLTSLDEKQKSVAVKPYAESTRVNWHFIPMKERKGLALREMDQAQRAAAMRLLRSALSETGYSKATQIMLMEQVLRELEGEGRTWERDWQKYYVTIFGDPSAADSPWQFSFEGHHLSLNFVCQGSEVVDSTPQFFAANPAILMSEVEGAPLRKGTQILAAEENLGFQLVNMLSEEQRKKAIIADEALSEIRAAGEAQPPQTPAEGISYRELTRPQLAVLENLVQTYAAAMPEDVYQKRMEAIKAATWGNVHFAWAGATEPGIGHYYRIQGPTFLIEFVNTQPDAEGNPANHIHCVWRDITGDFNLPVGN
jgi:hypothetical protein